MSPSRAALLKIWLGGSACTLLAMLAACLVIDRHAAAQARLAPTEGWVSLYQQLVASAAIGAVGLVGMSVATWRLRRSVTRE